MKREFRMPEVYAKPKLPDIPVVTKPIVVSESISFSLSCICCFEISDVLFSGSSYCKKCYLEKLRTGK